MLQDFFSNFSTLLTYFLRSLAVVNYENVYDCDCDRETFSLLATTFNTEIEQVSLRRSRTSHKNSYFSLKILHCRVSRLSGKFFGTRKTRKRWKTFFL